MLFEKRPIHSFEVLKSNVYKIVYMIRLWRHSFTHLMRFSERHNDFFWFSTLVTRPKAMTMLFFIVEL